MKTHWKKWFSTQQKEAPLPLADNLNQILSRLDTSLSNCDQQLRSLNNQVRDIRRWQCELIAKVYHVPNDLWYAEYDNFDNIKQLPQNATITDITRSETDQLIEHYNHAIVERLERVGLVQKLRQQYTGARSAIENVIKQRDRDQKQADNNAHIDLHRQKLLQLNDAQQSAQQIHQMHSELANLLADFQQVMGQLEALNQ